MSVRVLGLDPGGTTGYFVSRGYEPEVWGSARRADQILPAVGAVDVVVYEDALDLDRVAPLRQALTVPWVGITPQQLQVRLFSRVLGRKQANGPVARREVVRRAFGRVPSDPHALDAACLALWWLAGYHAAPPDVDLGNLRVWDFFTINGEFGDETYQIVPPNTADPANGLVSWSSPLARAVKDAEPGQRVTVEAPGGVWECTLVRIVSTGDDE